VDQISQTTPFRRLRMWQILELGIPVLEVLFTNRPDKIADLVENLCAYSGLARRILDSMSRRLSNTSNNPCEILAQAQSRHKSLDVLERPTRCDRNLDYAKRTWDFTLSINRTIAFAMATTAQA
jgi:hypothetical protein